MNDEEEIDRLLRALSDATRRHLLDRLRDAPGLTLGELTAGFPQTRLALS
jgi:DNA-binding transcriptional ArsR family regulator